MGRGPWDQAWGTGRGGDWGRRGGRRTAAVGAGADRAGAERPGATFARRSRARRGDVRAAVLDVLAASR